MYTQEYVFLVQCSHCEIHPNSLVMWRESVFADASGHAKYVLIFEIHAEMASSRSSNDKLDTVKSMLNRPFTPPCELIEIVKMVGEISRDQSSNDSLYEFGS